MTLDALRTFCAVVEEASFRRAAARVHRSQPAVSQQLQALEARLGHTLIERKTCKPTPVGRLLYERARRLLNDAEGLARELAEFDETAGAELRVGTSDTTALYFLPPFIKAFAEQVPQTHLALVNRHSEAIAELVARGELDLGIVTLPVSREELDEKELFRERFVLVTPEGHALGARKRLRLEELSEAPLLLLHEQTRTGALLREHFRRAAFEPKVVLDSGSFEVLKRYVAAGVGVAFLPEIAITEADEGLVTIRVEGLPHIHIGAVWRRGAYQSKAAQTFLKLITRE